MNHLSYSLGVGRKQHKGTTQMTRLLLKNVELQAKEKGLLIEKVSGGYIIDETKFKTLQAVVDYLEVVVIPTNNDVTEVIAESQGKGVNFKLFKHILDFFTTHPEQHNQNSFVNNKKGTYCVTRLAIETLLPGYFRRDMVGEKSTTLAGTILGLTQHQSEKLFLYMETNADALLALRDIVALEGQPPSVTLPAINEILYKYAFRVAH